LNNYHQSRGLPAESTQKTIASIEAKKIRLCQKTESRMEENKQIAAHLQISRA
jgi:ribosomal protein L9